MSTKTLDRKAAKVSRAYEADLYGWVEDQVTLLKAQEVGSIDASHIMQELEDLGRTEFNKVVSALRVILLHLLKWDHQPQRRSRSWANSVRTQRQRLADELEDSPSLKAQIGKAIARAYRNAINDACSETGLTMEAFPESCPYSWEDISSRVITWNQESTSERR
jgi:Domain of unknown function DUF29